MTHQRGRGLSPLLILHTPALIPPQWFVGLLQNAAQCTSASCLANIDTPHWLKVARDHFERTAQQYLPCPMVASQTCSEPGRVLSSAYNRISSDYKIDPRNDAVLERKTRAEPQEPQFCGAFSSLIGVVESSSGAVALRGTEASMRRKLK